MAMSMGMSTWDESAIVIHITIVSNPPRTQSPTITPTSETSLLRFGRTDLTSVLLACSTDRLRVRIESLL